MNENRAVLDPHQNYAWLRDNAPVCPTVDASGSRTAFLVTSYELVRSCLLDDRLSVDPRRAGEVDATTLAFEPSVLDSDPPDHERMRRLVHRVLSPMVVDEWRPRIREICREAISSFAERGEADLLTEYAQIVPVAVIHELLGIPVEVREPAAILMDNFWRAGLARDPDSSAMEFVADYVRRILDYKRGHRGNDIATVLLDGHSRGDLRDEAELRGMISAMLGPGFVTTIPMLATAIGRVLQHPLVLAKVVQDSDRWSDVVDEVLRHDSVVQVLRRYTTVDLAIGDVTIPKGSTVLLSLGSANRDIAGLDDPGSFSIERQRSNHLGFGHGIHFCLGVHLGRAEGEEALSILFDELPDLQLADSTGEIVWTLGPLDRGLASVPVTFSPRRTMS